MTQRSYRLVLIAIAAGLSAALAWQWGADKVDHHTARSAAGRVRTSDADGLRLRRTLQQAPVEARSGNLRDPFSYAMTPERDTASATRPLQRVVAKPKAPAAQEPVPIEAQPAAPPAEPPLRLLAVAVRGSKPVASLQYGEELLVVRIGELVADQRYRVERIDVESVTLVDLASGQQRHLPLGAPPS